MRLDCAAVRDLLIDDALGQAQLELAADARAHAESCAACRGEVAALLATIARLREPASFALSPAARSRLAASLDAIDACAPPRRSGAVVRLLDGARFRVVLLGHQLRTSRKWRLRVAAALLPLLFGIGLLLRGRAARPAARGAVVDLPRDLSPDTRSAGGEASPPPSLVGWQPKLDEPKEPVPPAPTQGFDELDLRSRQRVTEELVKVNQIEEDALARLRAGEKRPTPQTAPERGGAPAEAPRAANDRSAVERALDWLARNQRPDGSWTSGSGEPGLDTGVTALALLALVADGHLGSRVADGRDAALDAAADRAIACLIERQDRRDGRFRGGSDEAAQLFCHSVSCLALLEAHVRARAAGGLAGEPAAREQERIERALTRLEIDLDVLLGGGTSGARCAGQNAAWAALALATARHAGVDFHLKAGTERRVDRVLEKLRGDQPELVSATARTIQAMADRSGRTTPPPDPAWSAAVERVLGHPELAEPSLRFLVASALCARSAEWERFEATLASRLLALQSPQAGYFDSGRVWECFGGGVAADTALAVLTLTVRRRQEAWEQARLRAK